MPAPLTAAARRLSGALAELKEKVREALAGETAKAVGEAVRHAVAAALLPSAGSSPPDDWPPDRSRDQWSDDRDPRWADERWDADRWDDAPPPPLPPPAAPTTSLSDRTRLAVVAGVAAGRWWLLRGSVPAAVAVGGLVALAVLFGGPATHAAARALTAAADLAAVGRALRPPDDPD